MKTYTEDDPLFLDNIPNPMYKYRDWADDFHKRIVIKGEIYLPSQDQFNDPYDATLPFKYKEEDMADSAMVFTKLLELGRIHSPGIKDAELHRLCFERQNSGDFENGKYWKDGYEEHKKELNRFGILATTTKKDNLLMWAHYANCHKGFCIGFDKFILFKSIQSTLSPVIYEKELPKIPLLFNDKYATSYLRLLTTKSIDWRYEDEYRIVLIEGARTKFYLPPEGIKEIIFGLKMPEQHKEEISELVKEKLPHVQLFQSCMNLEEFKLDMIPLLKFPNTGQ